MNQKKRGFIEGTVDNSKQTYQDVINQRIEEMKKVKGKKRDCLERLTDVQEQIKVMEDERNALKKNMHRDYLWPS